MRDHCTDVGRLAVGIGGEGDCLDNSMKSRFVSLVLFQAGGRWCALGMKAVKSIIEPWTRMGMMGE
jgi:hypothetical protein